MPSQRLRSRTILLVGYALLFVAFDATATLFEVAPGVSAWYPSAGLNLALLLVLGARFFPVVFVATLSSGLVIASPSLPIQHLLLPSAIIALSNGAAAAWLRSSFDPDHPLDLGGMGRFVAVAVGLPAGIGVFAPTAYLITGLPGFTLDRAWTVITSWWIADAVGIFTLTPLCLILARRILAPGILDAPSTRQLRFRFHTRRDWLHGLAQALAMAGAICLAFFLPAPGNFQFYVCFLPLLWIALGHGLPHAVIGILVLNLGATAAIHVRGTPADLIEFQFFMLVLAITGLVLGVLVSERRRATSILEAAGVRLEAQLQNMSTLAAMHVPDAPPESAKDAPPSASSSPVASSAASSSPAAHRTPLHSAFSNGTIPDARSSDAETAAPHPHDADTQDVLVASSDILGRSAEKLVGLNEQLIQSRQHLRSVNDHKDRLLSMISHDLKNPLVGIRGLAEMLTASSVPDAQRPLSLIQRSAQQALDLLDNLLTWARLQTGHFAPTQQVYRLPTLVADAIGLLESQASQKQVTVENSVQPGIVAYADPLVVDTVLRNLISNAIKFTESGGYVSISACTAPGNLIEVSITDTGVGISAERLKQVFEIDREASTTSGTDGETGTGLGLHLCRELIERQGGSIWADSTLNIGTTFYFTLPAPETAPDPQSVDAVADTSSVASS